MLCSVVVLSLAVGWRERAAIDRHVLVLALSGLLGGSAIGAAVLVLLAGVHLAPIFAVVILATVLLSVVGPTRRASRPALLLGGAAAGVVGTMFGVHGPPSPSSCSTNRRRGCVPHCVRFSPWAARFR